MSTIVELVEVSPDCVEFLIWVLALFLEAGSTFLELLPLAFSISSGYLDFLVSFGKSLASLPSLHR